MALGQILTVALSTLSFHCLGAVQRMGGQLLWAYEGYRGTQEMEKVMLQLG